MGVIFDYFRAPDAKAAAQAMDRQGGPLLPEPAFDGVYTKWIDPQVILGSLVAFIRGTPYTLEMVRTKGVWPPPESAPQNEEEYDALPDDSPWKEGPFLEELDVETRDTLASVNDGRIADLAAQWAQIEVPQRR